MLLRKETVLCILLTRREPAVVRQRNLSDDNDDSSKSSNEKDANDLDEALIRGIQVRSLNIWTARKVWRIARAPVTEPGWRLTRRETSVKSVKIVVAVHLLMAQT